MILISTRLARNPSDGKYRGPTSLQTHHPNRPLTYRNKSFPYITRQSESIPGDTAIEPDQLTPRRLTPSTIASTPSTSIPSRTSELIDAFVSVVALLVSFRCLWLNPYRTTTVSTALQPSIALFTPAAVSACELSEYTEKLNRPPEDPSPAGDEPLGGRGTGNAGTIVDFTTKGQYDRCSLSRSNCLLEARVDDGKGGTL